MTSEDRRTVFTFFAHSFKMTSKMYHLGTERPATNATPLPKTPPETAGSTARPAAASGTADDDEVCEYADDGADKGSDAEKETNAEEEVEEDVIQKDFFHYPKPTDYSFIVANGIVPLATPDKWRHSMSSICSRGGNLLRITIVGCEFPGRCFDCKLNNKSVCFCFFGQNTRNGDHGVDLTPDLQQRLRRIECFATDKSTEEHFYKTKEKQGFVRGDALTQEWFALDDKTRAAHTANTITPSVEHFPDPDIIFKVKSMKRISKQHYIPPVVNLLCQAPFSNYFDEHTFDGMLRKQAQLSIGVAKSTVWKWREPVSNVTNRSTVLKGVRKMSRSVDRRARVAQVMSGLYGQWTSAQAGEKCNESCRLGACTDCKRLRGALKREYKEQVRKVVDNRIFQLFMASEGPFERFVHKNFNGEFYEDDSCRVVRIHVEH